MNMSPYLRLGKEIHGEEIIIIMEEYLFSKRRIIQIWVKAIFLKESTNAFHGTTN
jgi:hypothetical protein